MAQTSTIEASTPTQPQPGMKRRSLPRFCRRAALLLLAAAIVLGAPMIRTNRADAATVPPVTYVCAKGIDKTFWTGSWGTLTNERINLQAWVGGQWQTIGTTTTDTNGCTFYSAVPGYYQRFQISIRAGSRTWSGASGYIYVGNTGYYDFGTIYAR